MSTPHQSRSESRARMESAVIAAGREQLVSRGAANLSLREVARSIGVVSSAVYRYVSSRDELITMLVVDSYSSLADHVEKKIEAPASAAQRFRALALGMREWALDHREQWALIFGSPVPGYAAPAERTTGPGTRVLELLLHIAAETDPDYPTPSDAFARRLESELSELGIEATSTQGAFVVEAWAGIVGCISMEVFGQLGPGLEGFGLEVIGRMIDSLAERLTDPST